jgi:hypothetical protein
MRLNKFYYECSSDINPNLSEPIYQNVGRTPLHGYCNCKGSRKTFHFNHTITPVQTRYLGACRKFSIFVIPLRGLEGTKSMDARGLNPQKLRLQIGQRQYHTEILAVCEARPTPKTSPPRRSQNTCVKCDRATTFVATLAAFFCSTSSVGGKRRGNISL